MDESEYSPKHINNVSSTNFQNVLYHQNVPKIVIQRSDSDEALELVRSRSVAERESRTFLSPDNGGTEGGVKTIEVSRKRK